MKKLLIVLSTLILLTSGVMAAGSQSVEPVLNVADGSYTINGENADQKELKALSAVQDVAAAAEGDELGKVNDLIKEQNASGGAKVVPNLNDYLKQRGVNLGEGFLVVGKGFYEVDVVGADGAETHDGVTFSVKLQQITDRTVEVGAIHYSMARGFEYIKANKFDVANATAEFTLKDTSPIMFIIKYKDGQTAANFNPSKTGVDGTPTSTYYRLGALAILAGAATVAVLKKKHA